MSNQTDLVALSQGDATGLTPLAGSVVQMVQYYNASTSDEQTSSTSYVASSISKTITPKFSNSLIVVQTTISMTDPIAGILEAKIYLNGSAMPSAADYHLGYTQSARVRYAPFTNQVNYTCTTTDPLEFTVYYRVVSSGPVRITHPAASSAMTVWEIAQ